MTEAISSVGQAIQSALTPAGTGARVAGGAQAAADMQRAREQQAVAAAKQREEAQKRDEEAAGQMAAGRNTRGRRLLQALEGMSGGGGTVPAKSTLG